MGSGLCVFEKHGHCWVGVDGGRAAGLSLPWLGATGRFHFGASTGGVAKELKSSYYFQETLLNPMVYLYIPITWSLSLSFQ